MARVVRARRASELVLRDRRRSPCGSPVETTWGGRSGWAPRRREPDGVHHRLEVELGAELGLVLEHRRAPAPVSGAHARSAGGPPRSPGRSSPPRGRASAPPRPRCPARDGRRTGAPRGGEDPVAVVGTVGLGRLHEGRLREARLLREGEHRLVARRRRRRRPRRARCRPAAAPRRRPARRSGGPFPHDRDRAPRVRRPGVRSAPRTANQLGRETWTRLSADLLGGLPGPRAQPADHVLPDLHGDPDRDRARDRRPERTYGDAAPTARRRPSPRRAGCCSRRRC